MVNDLPVYAIRLRPFAVRSVIAAVVHVSDTSGKEGSDATKYAEGFHAGLQDALATLATLPNRFPVATEAAKMAAPPVRVMPYSYRAGGPVWRILYRVYEADENDAAHVEIVAIRHGAQKPLTRSEGRDIDAANR